MLFTVRGATRLECTSVAAPRSARAVRVIERVGFSAEKCTASKQGCHRALEAAALPNMLPHVFKRLTLASPSRCEPICSSSARCRSTCRGATTSSGVVEASLVYAVHSHCCAYTCSICGSPAQWSAWWCDMKIARSSPTVRAATSRPSRRHNCV